MRRICPCPARAGRIAETGAYEQSLVSFFPLAIRVMPRFETYKSSTLDEAAVLGFRLLSETQCEERTKEGLPQRGTCPARAGRPAATGACEQSLVSFFPLCD